MPRVLRGVENRSMSITALGQQLTMPLGIAPTAMQKMAHEDGELATARGLFSFDFGRTFNIEFFFAQLPLKKELFMY